MKSEAQKANLKNRWKRVINHLCAWTFALALAVTFYTYPWSWVMDRRVAKLGTENIVMSFDSWAKAPHKNGKIPVNTLPLDLASLKPVGAIKRDDGLYLVLKAFFVEESGIFVENPDRSTARELHTDPSFVRLGPRVYRYRIKG